MRQIVFDTETTGLEPELGHRIIEIGAIELVNRRRTGRQFHRYLCPDRTIDPGAVQVHGLTTEFLNGQPRFADVFVELREFLADAELIIHNAPFDVAFLDHEFERAGLPPSAQIFDTCIDTLALARETFPGKRNNLDALCERFGVSNAHRTLHGALLDAQLLAEVYLAMTRGQETLSIDIGSAPALSSIVADAFEAARATLLLILPTPDELAAHEAYLAALDKESRGRCVWFAQSAEDKLAA